MARNPYFNNFENSMEQDLIESLIVESIGIYGHEIFYLPRTLIEKDDVYGEDPLSEYNDAYLFEVYIKSYDSFEGDGTFLSKFYTEIRDKVTFTIAKRTFGKEITTQNQEIIRPREGDMIYSTMMKKLFVVQYVNPYPVFFQFGALQTWDVVCDMFEYSSERFNTGVAEIDNIERDHSISMSDFSLSTTDGSVLVDNRGFPIVHSGFDFDEQMDDVYADNDEIGLEGEGIIDWGGKDPFTDEED